MMHLRGLQQDLSSQQHGLRVQGAIRRLAAEQPKGLTLTLSAAAASASQHRPTS